MLISMRLVLLKLMTWHCDNYLSCRFTNTQRPARNRAKLSVDLVFLFPHYQEQCCCIPWKKMLTSTGRNMRNFNTNSMSLKMAPIYLMTDFCNKWLTCQKVNTSNASDLLCLLFPSHMLFSMFLLYI